MRHTTSGGFKVGSVALIPVLALLLVSCLSLTVSSVRTIKTAEQLLSSANSAWSAISLKEMGMEVCSAPPGHSITIETIPLSEGWPDLSELEPIRVRVFDRQGKEVTRYECIIESVPKTLPKAGDIICPGSN